MASLNRLRKKSRLPLFLGGAAPGPSTPGFGMMGGTVYRCDKCIVLNADSAAEGAPSARELLLPQAVKRCPDAKRHCSGGVRLRAGWLWLIFSFPIAAVAILLVMAVVIFPIAAVLAQNTPPTSTIGPAPAEIAPPRPNYPFPDGRGYVYSAEWHLITAGTGVVRMDVAGNERKVTASAESSGAVNVIFPVHDHFESHFNPRTFCSLSIFKHSEEGTHKRETSIQFDYARKKSTLDEKSLRTGETKHVESDLAGCTTDLITGFYYLQTLPLQLGASYEFPVSDGKTAIVHATVAKREQVRVPAGTFPTVLVTIEATSGPLQSKGKVWVWYSEDATHTPVQMRVKLGWGTLLFRLQRIEK